MAESIVNVAPIKGAGENALTQEEKQVGKSLKKAMKLSSEDLAAVNTKSGTASWTTSG